MIKAILFDFDGTLADTLPFYVIAYENALKNIGIHCSETDIIKLCFGKKEKVICTQLQVPEKTEEFATSYFDSVRTLFKEARLFADTIPTLQHLKNRKIKIAIVTFAYRWYIDQMINQFSLLSLIDYTISTDEVTHPKPHPEAVLKACEKFNIRPENTIVVGDSSSDILMAKDAGTKSALYFPEGYTKYYNISQLKKTSPNYIIKKLNELVDLT